MKFLAKSIAGRYHSCFCHRARRDVGRMFPWMSGKPGIPPCCADNTMNHQMEPSEAPAPSDRRVFASVVAALTAWAILSAGVAILFIVFIFSSKGTPSSDTGWGVWIFGMIAVASTVLTFALWLLVLLPLYLLLPPGSMFWKWPLCTACGAVGGAVLFLSWSYSTYPVDSLRFEFGVGAAVIGGVMGFSAALTRRRFQSDPLSPRSPSRE